MDIARLFNSKLMIIDKTIKSKSETIETLAKLAFKEKVIDNLELFIKDINARESLSTTGMGDAIAIPHCRSAAVKIPAILFAQVNDIDWQAMDNKPVKLVFMIAMPMNAGSDHLQALAKLSQLLVKNEIKTQLLNAKTNEEIISAFNVEVKKPETVNNSGSYDIIAITACPTGIAHTYMAQEKLEQVSKKLNLKIKVETQGRSGIDNHLTAEDIKHAKAIIIAADKNIEGLERFNNKLVLKTGTKIAINTTEQLLKDALNKKGEILKVATTNDFSPSTELNWKIFKNAYGHIMAGVSRMLPFVVAGGIIMGIAFLLDAGITGNDLGSTREVSGWFMGLGKISFKMMVPILGGFVAYSIIGWQGLLPGFIAGMIADGPAELYGDKGLWSRLLPDFSFEYLGKKQVMDFNSGFIGAIIGGFIAGLIVFLLVKVTKKTPKSLRGVRDIIFVPLFSVLLIGVVMFAINIPLGFLNLGIKLGISGMYRVKLNILVGIILAAMMAVDMGGPINKAAYVLGTVFIKEGVDGQRIMASVMAGGMVPPLAIALSTTIFKNQYTESERNAGISNWFMGLSFITEGAIPFAATRPKKVIPSIVIGSALTGALVMAFNISLGAPHGGIFVFALLRNNWFTDLSSSIGLGIGLYSLAIIIGMVTGALLLGLLNSNMIQEFINKRFKNKKLKNK